MSARKVCSALLLCALVLSARVASAECPVCGGEFNCQDPNVECCCKRGNKIKIIVKRPIFCAPIVPAAPVGYAVPSVAAVMTPTFAYPANVSVSPTGAGPNDALRQLIADEVRRQAGPAGAGPTAAGTTTCTDPCAEIRQLRADVDKLVVQVNRLGGHVETLAKDYKDRKDKEKASNP